MPAVETATAIAFAGIDHRTYLGTTDATERLVEVLVARGVLEARAKYDEKRDRNLAILVGNRVGEVVGSALDSALKAISRAMARG